ncbi:MAG: hypothetical protein R3E79_37850 [Caldilineaceae bacterium]
MPKQRIGIYLRPDQIVRNPTYLNVLRDQVGLNLLVLIYTGAVSQQVLAQSPFDGWPPSPETIRSILAQRFDGSPCTDKFTNPLQSVGPHVDANGDDAAVRAAVKIARDAGLEIWFMGGAWTANDADVVMYCPSKTQNQQWYEAVYTYLATAYDVDGLDITHARFPMRSFPKGLFLCACPDCARSAASLGYDMAAMQADIRHAHTRLQQVDSRRLVEIARYAMGPFDYLQLLGMRSGVIDWLRFRSDLLTSKLTPLRAAVHQAAGDEFLFGADTYPASFSLLAGHNHARWGECSDFASPLLSHVDIFPMWSMIIGAQFLLDLHPTLTEQEALQVVYRFAGYDHLAMPANLGEFAWHEPDCEYRHIPLVDMLRLDMAKAHLYLPQGIPSYPIIQGGGAPHDWPRAAVEQILADALALGHDGYIFQGTSSLVDFTLQP